MHHLTVHLLLSRPHLGVGTMVPITLKNGTTQLLPLSADKLLMNCLIPPMKLLIAHTTHVYYSSTSSTSSNNYSISNCSKNNCNNNSSKNSCSENNCRGSNCNSDSSKNSSGKSNCSKNKCNCGITPSMINHLLETIASPGKASTRQIPVRKCHTIPHITITTLK
mgnify:CR=1 FL=1